MNDQERILSILLRLQSGAHLKKRELAEEFAVSDKTIQRDFSLLRDFADTQPILGAVLEYNRRDRAYCFKGKSLFNKKDILILVKILLENRALNREENQAVIDGLLDLVSVKERKEIYQIIGSELLNYAPLTNQQERIDKIWELSEMLRQEKVLDIHYQSPYRKEKKEHCILPVSIYYDAHYFYLVAYHLKHEHYTTLRIDRILDFRPSDQKKPHLSYGRKFRDGDVRNQRVDAFIGSPMTVTVEFCYDPEIVLDQFPDAKILSQEGKVSQIRFTSQYTPGLKRWLYSQSEGLKVLAPQKLVDDMKRELQELLAKYEG